MHLALRKPGDDDLVATAGADVSRSLEAYALAPAPARTPAVAESEPAPADAGYSVETIRGIERERVKLDGLGAVPV